MYRGLLMIVVLGCAQPRPSGPAWPALHPRDSDGGESLAPRAAARAIAAAVEDDHPADRPADKPAAPAASEGAADKPAPVAPSPAAGEEPVTAEDIVIEVDD